MQLCMLYMGDCCCKVLRTKLALSRTGGGPVPGQPGHSTASPELPCSAVQPQRQRSAGQRRRTHFHPRHSTGSSAPSGAAGTNAGLSLSPGAGTWTAQTAVASRHSTSQPAPPRAAVAAWPSSASCCRSTPAPAQLLLGGGASRWRPGSRGRSAASPLFSTHARLTIAGVLSLSQTRGSGTSCPRSAFIQTNFHTRAPGCRVPHESLRLQAVCSLAPRARQGAEHHLVALCCHLLNDAPTADRGAVRETQRNYLLFLCSDVCRRARKLSGLDGQGLRRVPLDARACFQHG
jgi:hypothetical protein